MSDNYTSASDSQQQYLARPITPPNDRNKQYYSAQPSNVIPSKLGDAPSAPPYNVMYEGAVPRTTQPGTTSAPPRNTQPGHTGAAFHPPPPAVPRRHYQSNQRNDTTQRIEREVLSILQWDNPVRSGVILFLVVDSIILTRWYSLLQLGCAGLTIAIALNLVYVNLLRQSQQVLTNQEAPHPYKEVIENDKPTAYINRDSVNRVSSVMIDISETIIRALTRIIFIENTMTSVKWMSIFFVIWKISARLSTMDILLGLIISAFIFPRLYVNNKDVLDAQMKKGQVLIKSGIHKAHDAAVEGVNETYDKARSLVAQVKANTANATNKATNNVTNGAINDANTEHSTHNENPMRNEQLAYSGQPIHSEQPIHAGQTTYTQANPVHNYNNTKLD